MKNNTSEVGFNVGLYMSLFHFNVFFFSINPLLRIRYLVFVFVLFLHLPADKVFKLLLMFSRVGEGRSVVFPKKALWA